MGLFSTRSRLSFGSSGLSFGSSSNKRKERRRRVKSYSTASEIPGTIYIEVGEPEPFGISIDHTTRFDTLSETENSLVAKISYNDRPENEILKVHWSDVHRDSCDRDHVPSLMIGDYMSVPKYKTKETYRHYRTYITVSVRSYIKGHTLASVISRLSDDDYDIIFEQIQGFIWKLGEKQSAYFGHIQFNTLRSETPGAYITTMVMLDKMKSKLDAEDWKEIGRDMYRCPAIMCHGNLSPEHIILRGNTVVGIVGWGNGDFIPEVYDRLHYYFMSDPRNPRCWYRRLSEVTMNINSGRPSVEFIFNATAYVYRRRWRDVPEKNREIVTKLYNALKTNYTTINCLALATEIEGDNMSLSSLTSWWNDSERTIR